MKEQDNRNDDHNVFCFSFPGWGGPQCSQWRHWREHSETQTEESKTKTYEGNGAEGFVARRLP